MNILFLLKYYKIGGVETVTHVLANKFQSEYHNCTIFCLSHSRDTIFPSLRKDVTLIFSQETSNKEVIKELRYILLEKHIDIVINQSGHLMSVMRLLEMAKEGLSIKTLSIYHNMPNLPSSKSTKSSLSIGHVRFLIQQLKSRYGMRYIYKHSDLFCLLSKSFVNRFSSYTKCKELSKLRVIPNPITIATSSMPLKKEKEVIYVGRVDTQQKRAKRLIKVWALLEKAFPEWKFSIVGDGSALDDLKKEVHRLDLKRVCFTGFCNPLDYYKRASLLLLTSEYEGFPLVLLEAMTNYCIPVVYGSFPSVYDIIDSGKDGIIVPYCKDGFRAIEMANELKTLMANEAKISEMAHAASTKSEQFTVDAIYQLWMKVFNGLKL